MSTHHAPHSARPRMPAALPQLAEPHQRYDPWRDLRLNWPNVRVIVEPMSGDLLGEVRADGLLIALRAGTSAAQRRCTLTHELVHLERGLLECGPWLQSGPWVQREELQVHTTVARRLIPLEAMIAAIRDLGSREDRSLIAQWLEVDRDTLNLRIDRLTPVERRQLRRGLVRQAPLWSVA